MSRKWKKTELPCVEYFQDPSRPKYGRKFDTYYRARFWALGKKQVVCFGWMSAGWTPKKCYDKTLIYRENLKTNQRPTSWQDELDLIQEQKEAESKRQEAASISLREVAKDYVQKKRRKKDGLPLKENSKADIRKHINGTFADWADMPIKNITRQMVADRYQEAATKSYAQANQAFRVFRALYSWAKEKKRDQDGSDLLPDNPAQVLKHQWNAVPTRKEKIPLPMVGKVWNRLREIRNDSCHSKIMQTLADYASFLLLTGCRRSEAAELTWENVDLENCTWSLPDAKNRSSVTFPLSKQAADILQERPKDNDFVFASHRTRTGHVGDPRHIMKEISKAAGQAITPHDLRRTFRDIARECKIELWITKLLMNHSLSSDVTINAYTDTEDLSYLRDHIEEIGSWIERKALHAKAGNVADLEQERQKRAS